MRSSLRSRRVTLRRKRIEGIFVGWPDYWGFSAKAGWHLPSCSRVLNGEVGLMGERVQIGRCCQSLAGQDIQAGCWGQRAGRQGLG